MFLKLFRSKNIEYSPLYAAHSYKAYWNSIAIKGRIYHLSCVSMVSLLPQRQMFSSKCSSFRFLNDKWNAERNQIFNKASVLFLSLYIHFYVNLPDTTLFFFFDWFISCLVKRPHLNQQSQSYLLPQSYSVRFPLDQTFAGIIQELLWTEKQPLAVFAFQLTEVTPPFETRKLRLIIDNWNSHSFSPM